MNRRKKENNLPETYGAWNVKAPEIAPRSALYQVRPIGIGAPETESMTSYLARLAQTHYLSIGDLLKRFVIPVMSVTKGEPAQKFYMFSIHTGNGTDSFASVLVKTLEQLTLIEGIAPTTLVLWRNVIAQRELLRSHRAWCADCYAEQHDQGGPIYDHLLWTIALIKVCPRHQRRLMENCPDCGKRIWLMVCRSVPGFCPYCKSWLGAVVKQSAADDLTSELRTAGEILDLITTAPILSDAPPKENVTRAVNYLCDSLFEGSSPRMMRWLGLSDLTTRFWIQGLRLPTLKTQLELSALTGIPLVKFFTDPESIPEHLANHPVEVTDCRTNPVRFLHRRNRLGYQNVRGHLEAALVEVPPPSLEEVSQRLGYRYSGTLRYKHAELCKKITANYRASEEFLRRQQVQGEEERQLPDRETVRQAMEQELNQDCPTTLKELARKLGYRWYGSLCIRFPELSLALMEKRRRREKELLTERLNYCRQVLAQALTENPPPTLAKVASRSPITKMHYFKSYLAEESRAVSARHEAYRQMWLREAEEKMKHSLLEDPPRPLKQIAKELGFYPSTLKSNKPDLCRAISNRYKKYIRDRELKKKLALHQPGH